MAGECGRFPSSTRRLWVACQSRATRCSPLTWWVSCDPPAAQPSSPVASAARSCIETLADSREHPTSVMSWSPQVARLVPPHPQHHRLGTRPFNKRHPMRTKNEQPGSLKVIQCQDNLPGSGPGAALHQQLNRPALEQPTGQPTWALTIPLAIPLAAVTPSLSTVFLPVPAPPLPFSALLCLRVLHPTYNILCLSTPCSISFNDTCLRRHVGRRYPLILFSTFLLAYSRALYRYSTLDCFRMAVPHRRCR